MSVLVPKQQRQLRKARLAANRKIYAYNDRKNGHRSWQANRQPAWRNALDALLVVFLWFAFCLIVLVAVSN